MLTCLELVVYGNVQHMPWAREESLHVLMAQHTGRLPKVVELNASSLCTLAEIQKLLMVVRYPFDANALSALAARRRGWRLLPIWRRY